MVINKYLKRVAKTIITFPCAMIVFAFMYLHALWTGMGDNESISDELEQIFDSK